MENPEIQETFGTQDIGQTVDRKYTLMKTEGAIKNRQFRETDNTWHTRHMTYKTQNDDKQNKTKQKNNTDNTENLKGWATQTPQKTGPRGEHR